MKALEALYACMTTAALTLAVPVLWLCSRAESIPFREAEERLGRVPFEYRARLRGRPRIWIHGASLGEVKVAASLRHALVGLIPGCSIILSTFTKHGKDRARSIMGEGVPVVYAPLDSPPAVRRAMRRVQPDVLVFLETEIWPAWLMEASKQGIPVALINGRISSRSIGRYRRSRAFFKGVLGRISAFSMVGEEDAERIRSMGADPSRVKVNGNAKDDLLAETTDMDLAESARRLLGLFGERPVIVAGSTRSGEEPMLLEAYSAVSKAFPEAVMIIAPRHIRRAEEIERLVLARGYTCKLRSTIRQSRSDCTEQIIILDSFGELFSVYSLASVVFIGGSLVPKGGQNPLEAAVWGKPVLYGPFMEAFLHAREVLEASGASIEVKGVQDLAEKIVFLLREPERCARMGEAGRAAVLGSPGVTEAHAGVVASLYGEEDTWS